MHGPEILSIFENAEKNDLNYFEILGTDRENNSELSFPPRYAEYRKEWINRMYNNDPGSFPLHVDVESTNRCNLRCTMCQIDFASMKQGNIAPEIFEKVLEECSANHLPSMKFNYRGEPTMNRHLVDMIRKAKDAGIIEVQFNTNGVLVNETLARSLIEYGLDRIKFSIDGVSPEVYRKIRGTDYQNVVDNVRNLVRIRDEQGLIRPIVQVQMVFMQDNKEEVVRFFRFWKKIVNKIGFSRYRSKERLIDDERRVSEAPLVRVPCSQLWQRLLVTYDGQILMCCGDHKALNPLGNINEMSLKDAWNSKKLATIREMHLNNESEKIPACAICEVNCTDPDTAITIWERVKRNVQIS